MRIIFAFILNNDPAGLFIWLSNSTISKKLTDRRRIRELFLWRRIKSQFLYTSNDSLKIHNPLVLSAHIFVRLIWTKTCRNGPVKF